MLSPEGSHELCSNQISIDCQGIPKASLENDETILSPEICHCEAKISGVVNDRNHQANSEEGHAKLAYDIEDSPPIHLCLLLGLQVCHLYYLLM